MYETSSFLFTASQLHSFTASQLHSFTASQLKFSNLFKVLILFLSSLGFNLDVLLAQQVTTCELLPSTAANQFNQAQNYSAQCPNAVVDFSNYEITAPITIYVNVKFFPQSGIPNFDGAIAVQLANDLINTANTLLNTMPQTAQNGPNSQLAPHVPISKYQYKIYTENLPGDDLGGIWVLTTSPGQTHNMYNDKVIDINLRPGNCYSGNAGLGSVNDINLFGFNICHADHLTGGWGVPVYAGLLNHEMGHSLSLDHSSYCNNPCNGIDIDAEVECDPNCPQLYSCDGWNPEKIICPPSTDLINKCKWNVSNNMMSQGIQQLGLTPCQWEKVFNYKLASNSIRWSWADNCTEVAPTYYVQSGTNEVWDDLKLLNRNVEVKTGASLTIKCEVQMATNLKITVHRGAKLIVDGGKITNLCPDGKWGGIVVHGNNAKVQPDPNATLMADDAGVVIVKNNSLIEHAHTAISTSAPGYAYPDQVARWGGLVIAENSSFQNNKRAAEFMKYDFPNKSKFHNCDFGENPEYALGTVGVTIWDCDGITFTGNRFEYLDFAGIYGIDFGAIIKEGNNFEYVTRGIESQATYPFSSFVEVDHNNFIGNEAHIVSISTDKLDGLKITNNEFFDAIWGIWIEGPSKYDIRKNSFIKTETGTVSFQTGAQNNYIDCNTIQDVLEGNLILGNNRNLQFRRNSYINSLLDVHIDKVGIDKGRVRPYQGVSGKPADNCFSTNNADDIRALQANSIQFQYLHRTDLPPSCFVPNNHLSDGGINNYTSIPTVPGEPDCPNPEKDGGIGEPPYIKENLISMRQLTNSAYSNFINSGQNLGLQQTYVHAETGKNKVLRWLLSKALADNDYNQAEELLQGENTQEARKYLYGLKILKGDLLGASSLLNAYPQLDSDDQMFVLVQGINLKRLGSNAEFTLNPSQESVLTAIANSESSSRGYARAILGLLKGQRWELYTEKVITDEGVKGRSSDVSDKEDLYVVSPNPATDRVLLNYPIRRGETNAFCQISDLYGRIQHTSRLDNTGSLSLDVSNLAESLYTIQVIENGRVLYSSLLSIIR